LDAEAASLKKEITLDAQEKRLSDREREGIAGIIVIILLRYVVEREKTKTPRERASLSQCCALK
jgi:hypothetical protein